MFVMWPQSLRHMRQIAKALNHRPCCRILCFCQLGVGGSLFVFCHIGLSYILARTGSASATKAAKPMTTEKLSCEWLLFATLATNVR